EAIAERDRGELDLAPLRPVAQHPGLLAGQLDAGSLAEPEPLERRVQLVGAEPERDLCRADVGGALDDSGDVEVEVVLDVADRDGAPGKLELAPADLELGLGGREAIVERGR